VRNDRKATRNRQRTIPPNVMDNLEKAYQKYENGTINDIALEQAKVLNRYQQKKASFTSKII